MKQNIVERKIMWGDLDPLGIVFYPRYYEWNDASAHLFFESIGLDLDTLWQRYHILLGLVETSCRYSHPGRYHERINIVTQLEELSEKTLRLRHTVYHATDNELMVTGFEKRICMDVSDPKNIRAAQMPPQVYRILKDAVEA